jgi:hypothetical protein
MPWIACLQPRRSSFRIVATSTASGEVLLFGTASTFPEKVTVETSYCNSIKFSEALGGWGFIASDFNVFEGEQYLNEANFFEVRHTENEFSFSSFEATVGSLIVQWNPCTVIALQGFLWRAFKDFSKRFRNEMISDSGIVCRDFEKLNEKRTLSDRNVTCSGNRPRSLGERQRQSLSRPLTASLHLDTLSVT